MRPPSRSTLFIYTTLFRSPSHGRYGVEGGENWRLAPSCVCRGEGCDGDGGLWPAPTARWAGDAAQGEAEPPGAWLSLHQHQHTLSTGLALPGQHLAQPLAQASLLRCVWMFKWCVCGCINDVCVCVGVCINDACVCVHHVSSVQTCMFGLLCFTKYVPLNHLHIAATFACLRMSLAH